MIAQKKIAEYFNVGPELVPFIPTLLADLWEMGSSPELILQWIRNLNLPPDLTRVLDVGCGKGAISISLAKKFDFQIKGIDFFEPFIQEAQKKAKEFEVSSLCRFEVADIREVISSESDYNIVLYTAVGDVLGSLDQRFKKLRQTVNPGGLVLIDDVFLKDIRKTDFPGYHDCMPYKETVGRLTACGDRIIKEKIFSREEIRFFNQQNTDWITKRARNLARRFPEVAGMMNDFVEKQKRECAILEDHLHLAVWMIQTMPE